MSNRGKAYLFILVAMILVSLSLAGGVYYLLEQEKGRVVKLKNSLDDTTQKFEVVKREKKAVSQRFKNAKKSLFSYNRIKAKSQKQIVDLKEELTQKEALQQMMEKELDDLKRDTDSLKTSNKDLESRLTEANETIKKSDQQLKDALAQKATLEKTVEDLRAQAQKVELGTIVVGSEQGKPPETPAPPSDKKGSKKETKKEKGKKTSNIEQAKAEKPKVVNPPAIVQDQPPSLKGGTAGSGTAGKVLVINKDYNFAVINLGSKDGIKLGDTFAVYHNDAYVGDVKVEKIHDSMSAAGFGSQEVGFKVNEGDQVVLKK